MQTTLEDSVKLAPDFSSQLKISDNGIAASEEIKYEEDEDRDGDICGQQIVDSDDDVSDDDEDGDFSFVCPGDDVSQIAAEDAFFNGQIRPVYPVFNRDLLLGDLSDRLPVEPPVKNVFVQTCDATSSRSGNDESDALACDWAGKAVEAAGPDGCKKSNSTGFSKFWRYRDLLHRSNSDGRDAFVFLNNPAPSTSAPAGKIEDKKETGKVKVNGNSAGKNLTQKKKSKKEVSAHERYMKSKAKEEDRRRSYLPYRPELVGFFTNVKGGLTRNVHPF